MRTRKSNLLNACVFSLLFYFGCSDNINISSYIYNIPGQTNDGWETASLASVGMDEIPIVDLMNELNEIGEHKIHSLLIVKDGTLVFEEYFQGDKFKLAQYTGETGFDRNDTHTLCSATKSFTSALIGIAIDNDFIQSVDQKVFDFFPEYSDILANAPEKRDISLKHLLTMTSGLDYDDQTYSYYDPRNDMYLMYESEDPIRFLLSKELVTAPGMAYKYNNNNTIILGEIIHKATGQRLDTFSENYLFDKLGITNFEWQIMPAGVVLASGELRLCSRDMAKFGLLFLNNGLWNSERIISQEWIDISTFKHIYPDNNWGDLDGYGYQWWLWESISTVNFSAYAASGWGGQWIIVSPGLHTVIVLTGGNYYTEEAISIQSILVNYLIPSISHGTNGS